MNIQKLMVTTAVVAITTLLPDLAFAQSSDLAPITNISDFILDFLTGPFARSIAGIAVVTLGIMAKAGRLKWQHAASILFGIALVFGGSAIANQLASAAG